jgi:hypothetical protein
VIFKKQFDINFVAFFPWCNSPYWARASSLSRLYDYTDTPHPLGLPWTSDQPVAGNSTSQHTTLTRDRRPCCRWDSNPQSQQANGGAAAGIDFVAYTVAIFISFPVRLLFPEDIGVAHVTACPDALRIPSETETKS